MEAPPRSTWLMKPKLWFIMPAQMSAERNAGKAYGRISTIRYHLRPRIRASLNTIARNSPRKKVEATEMIANTNVQMRHVDERAADRLLGECPHELSNPTKICQPGRSSSPFSAVKAPVPMSV